MKTIAIIVAMSSEFELVKTILTSPQPYKDGMVGQVGQNRVVLLKSGIGKVNAAVHTTNIINELHPDYVINTGVGGGLKSFVKQGDLVVADRVCYHDVWCGEGHIGQVQGLPLYFETSSQLCSLAKQIKGVNCHFGLICSGDQFVTKGEDLDRIVANFEDAYAVDMESAPIAHVCYLYNVPFISLRVISDSPYDNDDNTNQYFDFIKDAPQRTFEAIKQLLTFDLYACIH